MKSTIISIIITLFCVSCAHHQKRFFFIGYEVDGKGCTEGAKGDFWFATDSFPSKNYIDSSIYSVLPKIKSCYSHPRLTTIFEFKSEEDEQAFNRNYQGTFVTSVKQDTCTCAPWGSGYIIAQ